MADFSKAVAVPVETGLEPVTYEPLPQVRASVSTIDSAGRLETVWIVDQENGEVPLPPGVDRVYVRPF
jgi:hypothetical protein